MFYIAILWFGAMILAAAVVIGFSQIFKLGQGIRVIWAAIILMGLTVALIIGITKALDTAAIPSPTKEESREEFFQKYVDGRPGMTREQFN